VPNARQEERGARASTYYSQAASEPANQPFRSSKGASMNRIFGQKKPQGPAPSLGECCGGGKGASFAPITRAGGFGACLGLGG